MSLEKKNVPLLFLSVFEYDKVSITGLFPNFFTLNYVISNNMIFGKFDSAKDVWNMLAQRFNITQLAQRFQITKLIHMCQEPGQLVIHEFYS